MSILQPRIWIRDPDPLLKNPDPTKRCGPDWIPIHSTAVLNIKHTEAHARLHRKARGFGFAETEILINGPLLVSGGSDKKEGLLSEFLSQKYLFLMLPVPIFIFFLNTPYVCFSALVPVPSYFNPL
jgi:hypothetical protein